MAQGVSTVAQEDVAAGDLFKEIGEVFRGHER